MSILPILSKYVYFYDYDNPTKWEILMFKCRYLLPTYKTGNHVYHINILRSSSC